MTLATPPFRKKVFRRHVRTVPEKIHVKFELCSFNRFGTISVYLKFRGSRDTGHARFSKRNFQGSCPDCPGNIHVKFEVCSFNRFGGINI